MAAILNYTDLLYNYYNNYINNYIALMLFSTYGSNFTQITPIIKTRVVFLTIYESVKGAILFWL